MFFMCAKGQVIMRIQIVQNSGAVTSGEVEYKSLNEIKETLKDGWLIVKSMNGEVLVKVSNILNIRRKA